ncbi:MAG: FAD-dependent oxidoreductase [Candidatus Hydrogenedentota bacterium]
MMGKKQASSLTRRQFLAAAAAGTAGAGYGLAVKPSRIWGAGPEHTVLVEAEGFEQFGGWVHDTQVMDQMGSPYLMAHGLGRPVEDAVTHVEFPAAGQYRVLVRTRDWGATFDAPTSPGRFQVLVNGEASPVVFGTNGEEWDWQEGGTIQIDENNLEVEVALRDLTGFNGRCDAIVFTTDADFVPPDEGEELAQFRREMLGHSETPDDGGTYDLVVVGGGIAGTCAAISASRLGLSVAALTQDRPVLGGNNSSEVRVHLQGDIQRDPYPAIGKVVDEMGPRGVGNAGPPEQYRDAEILELAERESDLELFLNMRVNEVETEDGRLVAVIAQDVHSGRRVRLAGQWFVDSTGDANVGYLAGADYRYGREGRDETGESRAPEEADQQVMGASVQWRSKEVEEATPYPETPWAIQFTEETYQQATHGEWNWETGFGWHQIDEFEKVRDNGLRAVFGNWSYQKNHVQDPEEATRYANRELEWVAYVAGKRASRRMLGDVILQQQDIEEQREYSDAAVTATWGMDLHYPTEFQVEHFPGEEFRAYHETTNHAPYPVPYRCFYSRNVDNLFMAGRNISVTYVALGTVRVMRTLGMVGEVVAMAASICKRHGVNPRHVYSDHLDELKELMTEGIPEHSATA